MFVEKKSQNKNGSVGVELQNIKNKIGQSLF